MPAVEAPPPKDASVINAYFRDFPDAEGSGYRGGEIPGIAAVRFQLVPGATYGFVHMRQFHRAEYMTPEERRQVRQCQTELEQAMLYLMQHPGVGLEHVYSEGDINGKNHTVQRISRTRDLVRLGAHYLLANSHGLQISGAEREAEYERSGVAIDEGWEHDRWNKAVKEDREDALLEIITSSRPHIGFTSYGAAHNWRNNIKKHNADPKNKKKLFSWAELTPHEVAKYDEKMAAGY